MPVFLIIFVILNFLLAGACLAGSNESQATNANENDTTSNLHITWENDLYSNDDDGYTNGFAVSWSNKNKNLPKYISHNLDLLPFFPKKEQYDILYSIGQKMFTPGNLEITTLQPNDIPYAGFLYGTLGVIAKDERNFDMLSLTLGLIGEASGAEQTQKFIHKVVGATDPKGWNHQLENELGVILSYDKAWLGLDKGEFFHKEYDITPHYNVSLGNVYTHLEAGIILRFGGNLSAAQNVIMLPPRGFAYNGFSYKNQLQYYCFFDVSARAVARNIFIDGSSFESSHNLDRKNIVGEAKLGFVTSYKNTQISYTYNLMTDEYKGQSGTEGFGSINLTFRY